MTNRSPRGRRDVQLCNPTLPPHSLLPQIQLLLLDGRDGLLSVQSMSDKVQVGSCGRAFRQQIANILPVRHTTDVNIPTPVYTHVYPADVFTSEKALLQIFALDM